MCEITHLESIMHRLVVIKKINCTLKSFHKPQIFLVKFSKI